MKIYAINGGPRKKWNTATMLNHFVDGVTTANSQAEVETIHLFDLDYKGCVSCFSCKRDADTYGKCAIEDSIHDLLQAVTHCDGVVLASPIYFGNITAQLRAFLERLWFPLHSFEKGEKCLSTKVIPSAMIYTMNVTQEQMLRSGYDVQLGNTEKYMEYHFHSKSQILYAFNTYEFQDYRKYRASGWNEVEKAEWNKTQFPLDCRSAFEAGQQIVAMIEGNK